MSTKVPDPLGICVIGSGRAGMIHARNFAGRVPHAALTALVDARKETVDESCRELGVKTAYTDYRDALNPDSMRVVAAQLEPTLASAEPDQRFQFERHGYFVADRVDSKAGAPVFNRTVTLKDSWAAKPAK